MLDILLHFHKIGHENIGVIIIVIIHIWHHRVDWIIISIILLLLLLLILLLHSLEFLLEILQKGVRIPSLLILLQHGLAELEKVHENIIIIRIIIHLLLQLLLLLLLLIWVFVLEVLEHFHVVLDSHHHLVGNLLLLLLLLILVLVLGID